MRGDTEMNKQYLIGTYGYLAIKRLKSAEKNLDIDADVVAYASHQAIANILKHYILTTQGCIKLFQIISTDYEIRNKTFV